MLRLILSISLIIASVTGIYFLLIHQPEREVNTRPEISPAKQEAIAKRAEQKQNAAAQDEADKANVLKLEQAVQ